MTSVDLYEELVQVTQEKSRICGSLSLPQNVSRGNPLRIANQISSKF